MKKIITIQHTQSVHHTNGMIGAWTDWPLTDLGKKEAGNIGSHLKSELYSKDFIMYSSDLKRAAETASCINAHLGLVPIIRKELREVNVGIDTATPVKWFDENKCPLVTSGYDPDYKPFPNAESDRELWNRIHSFMEEIISSRQENMILVSHGITLRFFFSMWVHDDFHALQKSGFGILSGGVSKLTINDNGQRAIQCLNDSFYKRGDL